MIKWSIFTGMNVFLLWCSAVHRCGSLPHPVFISMIWAYKTTQTFCRSFFFRIRKYSRLVAFSPSMRPEDRKDNTLIFLKPRVAYLKNPGPKDSCRRFPSYEFCSRIFMFSGSWLAWDQAVRWLSVWHLSWRLWWGIPYSRLILHPPLSREKVVRAFRVPSVPVLMKGEKFLPPTSEACSSLQLPQIITCFSYGQKSTKAPVLASCPELSLFRPGQSQMLARQFSPIVAVSSVAWAGTGVGWGGDNSV